MPTDIEGLEIAFTAIVSGNVQILVRFVKLTLTDFKAAVAVIAMRYNRP